jgi:DNA-binding NarL/FixJ family response regulator
MQKSNHFVRVLLVDDYEPFRRFVRATLQARPELEIIGEASDGLEAVQKAKELQPDLILLDVGLPKLNGIEVAHRISSLVQSAIILFVSQQDDADVVRAALSNGQKDTSSSWMRVRSFYPRWNRSSGGIVLPVPE